MRNFWDYHAVLNSAITTTMSALLSIGTAYFCLSRRGGLPLSVYSLNIDPLPLVLAAFILMLQMVW